MNFGDCPYEDCGGFLVYETPARTPAFAPVVCDDCGRTVRYKFSRVDPDAFTDDEFMARYRVDPETHRIAEKEPKDE